MILTDISCPGGIPFLFYIISGCTNGTTVSFKFHYRVSADLAAISETKGHAETVNNAQFGPQILTQITKIETSFICIAG